MVHFSGVTAWSVLLVQSWAATLSKRAPAPFTDFTKNEFFKPAADAQLWGTLYARSLQLPDESLLMTWENYPAEPPLVNHPIYRSTDGGATWSNYSAIYDQINGWGMRFQPFLYNLAYDFGGFPAGTIFAAGVSTPESLTGGVWIDLYASTDDARTFNFVSHIAYGDGPETITSGSKAIWEPYILMYDGLLVVYFSDQRDPDHSQKLVHVTTGDLKTWSNAVEDVANPDYDGRPGMTTVAHVESTNKWIMTYENCGTDNCKVYYKVSDSPLTFGGVQGTKLSTPDGTDITNGPYVIWTPNPAKTDSSGTIIVSGTSREEVFINTDDPLAGQWQLVNLNHWSAYSRSLKIVTLKGEKKLLLCNGGNFGPKENNGIADAITEVPYV